MLAGLGMFLAGCSDATQSFTRRPGTPWPTDISRPTGYRPSTTATPATTRYTPPTTKPVAATGAPPGTMPRSWWTKTGPVRSKVNPMNGVNRITVHHEGMDTIWFTDARSTQQHLERIRQSHTGSGRGWGDIGYHYIIDRSGRVIEARSVAYQGAHVSQQNEHNVGVMLLGNFEKQTPSQAQLTTLQSTLRHLMATYRVPVNRVYTHRELGPTVCPGRNLQPRVASLRTSGALA